jgi:hypothetical protein
MEVSTHKLQLPIYVIGGVPYGVLTVLKIYTEQCSQFISSYAYIVKTVVLDLRVKGLG